MARESKKGFLQFSINGKTFTTILDWQDIAVLATFDGDNVQANISTTELEGVNDAAAEIVQWVEEGLSGGVGIFEGIPMTLNVYNENGTLTVFDGYADLSDNYRESLYKSRVSFKLQKKQGLNGFNERLESITYGYLESIGVFSDSDYTELEYLIEKKDNALEILISAVTLFLMVKELIEATKTTVETIGDLASLISTGSLGGFASAIKAVVSALVIVAYNLLILLAVIELTSDLFQMLISLRRTHKTISLRLLLEKVCTHLGYGFESDITELDKYYYLPSNNNLDDLDDEGFISITKGTQSGIPNITDNGYLCSEMFANIKEMFYARFAIIDNTVHFRNVDSDYWVKQSIYKMPNVLEKDKGYNTSDLKANRFISFQTDLNDEWTIDNFTGTNYEVTTDAVTTVNLDAKNITGLETVSIPYALGNRKNELNALEKFLKIVAATADELVEIVGGSTNYAGRIKERIGMLKVSQNDTSVPKILYLDKGKMPATHRSLLSAKYLYNNFHIGKSFVNNNYFGQKIKYSGVRIPFGFEDYKKVIENSYFYDPLGRVGKITKLEYNISGDIAVVDFWIREKYTVNLVETLIEP